jgi:hypothetical protein
VAVFVFHIILLNSLHGAESFLQLTAAQPHKIFPAVYLFGTFVAVFGLATGPYPKADEFSPHLHILFILDPF